MKNKKNIQYFENAQLVAQEVANTVESLAGECIAKRGVFHWSLAGGKTPRKCYELLRGADIDWSKVHVWFGDERCLPVDDDERNDVMAEEALLMYVDVPYAHIHRISAERGAKKAATLYEKELSKIDCLDLALLGMGADGHTASLFPNNPALDSQALVVPVFDSPKFPSERVSMGYKALKSARKRVVMVTGKVKRKAFEKVCAGESLPVNIDDSDWCVSI